jgi:hypothetical protein
MPSFQSATFLISVRVRPDIAGGSEIVARPMVMSDADDERDNDHQEISTGVANRPQPPTLTSIKVTDSKLTAIGAGFIKPVRVLIDGVEFNDPPRVRGTRVTQIGTLRNGSSIGQAVRPGVLVTITFRNGNGAEVTAFFRR